MKIVNIITAVNNGAGLQKDAELFAALLRNLGHQPRLIPYDIPHTGIFYKADISVFMEVMLPEMLNHAKENWFMPNSEWYNKSYECGMPFMSKILCKTQDCLRIWEQKMPGKCIYTGFESSDYWLDSPYEQRENAFLHLAGNSRTKNTEAVVEAWIKYNIPYNLELVIRDISWIPKCLGKKNITHHGRLPENLVQIALNARWFHIMPSHYEGFGHVIHEALGCGGIVLTTDAPPMNEIKGVGLLIPSSATWTKELATCHTVTPEDVYKRVMDAVALPTSKRIEISRAARQAFLENRENFRKIIKDLVG